MGQNLNQNRVSAVVWPWTADGAAALRQADRPWLRATVTSLIALTIAAVLYGFGRTLFAAIVASIAVTLWLIAMLAPGVDGVIQRLLQRFANFVGTGLTWLLLVPFFYLSFPIGHLVLKLKGRDPLEREFPTERPTYWIPRPVVEDAEAHCRRQF